MWLVGTGFSEAVLEERSASLRSKVIPKPKVWACLFPSDAPTKGLSIIRVPGIILLCYFQVLTFLSFSL